VWFEELAYQTYFFEELGLSLALKKEKIPLKLLTLEMNFSVQAMNSYFRATGPPGPDLQPDNMSPLIVHYHHKYDTKGLIMKTGYKIPDLAIEQINKLVLNSSDTGLYVNKAA